MKEKSSSFTERMETKFRAQFKYMLWSIMEQARSGWNLIRLQRTDTETMQSCRLQMPDLIYQPQFLRCQVSDVLLLSILG